MKVPSSNDCCVLVSLHPSVLTASGDKGDRGEFNARGERLEGDAIGRA